MLSKLAKVNGNWKWIVFSDAEEKEIRSKHRDHCNKIFRECMEDAQNFIPEPTNPAVLEIAAALFSKRADAIFSTLQKEVDQAICNMQKGK